MTTSEEMRFRVARVGAEDIDQLSEDPDLRSVWRQIRHEASSILRDGGKSIILVGKIFPAFQVDMWTDFP
jgi:hypothetical protein